MTSQHRERSKKVPWRSGGEIERHGSLPQEFWSAGIRHPAAWSAAGPGTSTSLDDQAVSHLELIMVDLPADAV